MREFELWFTPEARQPKCGDCLPLQNNDAYKRKNGVVGGKDLNALLHLALHSRQIGNSILYFREYITVYECKASNAEDVTNKDESIGWVWKRDWPMEDMSFWF